MISPSPDQVDIYLKNWDSNEDFVLPESSLRKLFTQTYPHNVEVDDVLVKVCSLNKIYNTNIYSPLKVAKRIVELKIDQLLLNQDFTIVNKLAVVKVNDHQTRNNYSFATKYCSHHRPEDYPIYDSFVEKILMHFEKKDKFFEFKKKDLRDYSKFRKIILEFRKFYGLGAFTLKQIDKYLWQAGKKYFPK